MTSQHPLAATLPEQPLAPGVYLFKDAHGRILYVGKAKSLRKRLASYFRKDEDIPLKTRAMLRLAATLDTLCTETEKEALLLEASLIKKHRPRYNIVLRDDKSYVLFRLEKAHAFPRLTLTRRVTRDGSVFFGPFTSAKAARESWQAIHQTYPLRRCNETTFRNRVRPCLYHYMHLCPGPCVLPVDRDWYAGMVRKVELLLAGRSGELVAQLEQQMHAAAETLEFETAAQLRDQIAAIRQTVERQAAVLPEEADLDVAGLAPLDKGLGLCLLFIRGGRLLDKKAFFWPGQTLEDGPEALAAFLVQYYEAGRLIPERILLPWPLAELPEDDDSPPDAPGAPGAPGAPLLPQTEDVALTPALQILLSERRQGPVRLAMPRTSVEKQLMALAQTNAREAASREPDILAQLQRALRLPHPPRRIEAVDVSHTAGRQTVVGLIVYEDGRHEKSLSRQYAFAPDALPGAPGDDYAVLHAWAARRLESGPPWPDLLLVDGGRGQLASVRAGFQRAAPLHPDWIPFPLAAIAKGRGETERVTGDTVSRRLQHGLEDQIYLPGRKNPLPLSPGSPELLFLQRVRDTVHHFAIGAHRRRRGKAILQSEILQLPGVGPKTARLLWDHFQTLEAMAAATPDQLAAIPGLGGARGARVAAALARLRG